MPRYVQCRDGTMAGSIGDGKTDVPTAADLPTVRDGQHAPTSTPDVQAVHAAFVAAKTGRGGTAVVPGRNDFASAKPDLVGCADGWDPATVAAHDDTPRDWRCEAGHAFTDTAEHVMSRKSFCPYCAGRRAIAGQTDLATTHPDLAAMADGWDPTQAMARDTGERDWRCQRGHPFTASPATLAGRRNVCQHPDCRISKGGFNREAPGHLYVLHAVRDGQVVIQYGITNNLDGRLAQHRVSGFVEDPILVRSFDHGSDAAELESQIKQFQAASGVATSTQAGDVFDGSTEAFRLTDASANTPFMTGFLNLVAHTSDDDTEVASTFATLRAALDADAQRLSREATLTRVGLTVSAHNGVLDEAALAEVSDPRLREALQHAVDLGRSAAFQQADAAEQQRQQVHALADRGLDAGEIATSLQMRPRRVADVLAARERDQRILTDFQSALAADEARQSSARHGRQRLLAETADRHDVSADTVRRVVAGQVPNTRKARLSDKDRADILRLAKTGASKDEIAAKIGVSPASVYGVLSRAGVRSGPPPVTEKAATILARQAQGATPAQIAQEVGGSENSVRKVLREHGVNLAAKQAVASDARKAHVLALAAAGRSAEEITEATGVSYSHQAKIFKTAGVPSPADRRRMVRDAEIRAYKKAHPEASLSAMVAALGESQSTIHRALTSAGD